MIKKLFTFFLAIFLITSCSNNMERNTKQLDEIYGYCDNPARGLRGKDYKICKAKEMGGETDFEPQSIRELLLGSDTIYATTTTRTINQNLWNGALETLKTYPIKNIDSTGGYIDTDWIISKDDNSNRCSIKVQITSQEFISNGVDALFICQNNIDDVWVSDEKDYSEENKKLVIAILENANEFYQLSLSQNQK